MKLKRNPGEWLQEKRLDLITRCRTAGDGWGRVALRGGFDALDSIWNPPFFRVNPLAHAVA